MFLNRYRTLPGDLDFSRLLQLNEYGGQGLPISKP
jgi:hypothetical protein